MIRKKILLISLVLIILIPLQHKSSSANNIRKKEVYSVTKPPIYPILANAFRAIIVYLGQEYLSYKLEGVFEYLEGNLSSFAKQHLKKVWSTYDDFQKRGKTNHQNIYINHYHQCEICSKIGEIITRDEFSINIENLQNQINRINSQSAEKISNLENRMNKELLKIDYRFISLEENLIKIENQVHINSTDIKKQGEQIADNKKNIAEWSLPRIIILRDKNYEERITPVIYKHCKDCKIVIRDITISKSPSIVLINNRMSQLAESISRETKIEIIPYKNTGIIGYDDFDIIIFL